MCIMHRIAVFLLFITGITISLVISESIRADEVSNLRSNPNSENFVLVNPRQVHYLERTLQRFVSKLATPIGKPVVLRSTSSKKDNLQITIRQIGDSIRWRLMKFAESCGMMKTVQQYEQSPSNLPISKDWFSEVLLQGSKILCDLCNMSEEIWSSMDLYFSKQNISLFERKHLSRNANGFQFLGAIDDVTDYTGKLSACLLQMASKQRKTSFDLNKGFLNLARAPPKVLLKTITSSFNSVSLDSTPSDNPTINRLHVFLCLAATDNGKNGYYDDCMEELSLLDKCMSTLHRYPINKIDNNIAAAKSWVRAIKELSDCKTHLSKSGKVYVYCGTKRIIPRSIKGKVKFIYEGILDRKIPKQSVLHRTADQLANVLSKSNWGTKFIDELCQYFAIYRKGRTKFHRLSKVITSDKKIIARRRKISEALEFYRKGLLLRTVVTINKIHRTTTDFEKFFIHGIKTTLNETWQSHVKILSCLAEWMSNLLELYGNEKTDAKETKLLTSSTVTPVIAESHENTDWDTDASFERYKKNNELQHSGLPQKRNGVQKDADIALMNLMKSMNRASRFRSAHNNSMLGCLANNLLLVAMFMETIGFVSTLFCFGHQKDEVGSSEIRNEWRSGRLRRSPEYHLDFNPISEEYSSFIIAIREGATLKINNENNWQLYQKLWNGINRDVLNTMEIDRNNTESDMNVTKGIFIE